MSERRWRVTARGRGLFAIEVDDGGGFRAATAAEVDAALRQRERSTAPHVQVTLGGQDAERLIHGVEDGGPWRPAGRRSTTRRQIAQRVDVSGVVGARRRAARVGASSGRPSSHPSRRQSDAGVDAAGVGR